MIVILFIALFCSEILSQEYTWTADSTEANANSVAMLNLINDWRESEGLDPLTWSPALQFVAQLRVDDYEYVYEYEGTTYSTYLDDSCCPYLSWTGLGPWEEICWSTTPYSQDKLYAQAELVSSYVGYSIPTQGIAPYGTTFTTYEDCLYHWNVTDAGRGSRLLDTWYIYGGCAFSAHRCHCTLGYSTATGHERDFQCNSVDATDPTVCGGIGVGLCQAQDTCKCFEGYCGSACESTGAACEDDDGDGVLGDHASSLSFEWLFL